IVTQTMQALSRARPKLFDGFFAFIRAAHGPASDCSSGNRPISAPSRQCDAFGTTPGGGGRRGAGMLIDGGSSATVREGVRAPIQNASAASTISVATTPNRNEPKPPELCAPWVILAAMIGLLCW